MMNERKTRMFKALKDHPIRKESIDMDKTTFLDVSSTIPLSIASVYSQSLAQSVQTVQPTCSDCKRYSILHLALSDG